jgi:glycosyltransferase involved in cell wall biosynthesis
LKKVEKSSEILVSIIVITYNSGKYVIETLESAKAQTYQNIELIVSDDCSTDNTIEICNEWIGKNRGRFIRAELVTSERNTGISANCNRGLKAAKGEWLKMIAGDDILTNECISRCMEFIRCKAKENIQIVHGSAKMYEDNFIESNYFRKRGKIEWKFNRAEITPQEQYDILLRVCPVVAPTVFMKKNIFDLVGYFDEDIPFWEDRPMWLKLTKAGIRFYFIDAELVGYRVHSASVQKPQNREYFSDYLISRDNAFSEIVLPNLPVFEGFINRYLIFIRRIMIKLGLNKNNKVTDFLYTVLTYFAEKKLNKLNGLYDEE